MQYLAGFNGDVIPWARATAQVGWLNNTNGTLAYVHPGMKNGVIPGGTGERMIFRPEQHSPTITAMQSRGTLSQWQKHVARPCVGNPILVGVFCLPFAGPLLKAARTETGGIHLYGRSSRGKTTAAQVAASVFGCGADPSDAPEQAYMQRWNITTNALEGLAAAHNDGLLVLDEIHTCNTKDFGRVVYNLAGGRGKAAFDKDRSLRPQRTWRALILSTGEISSRQKIEESGAKARAGQLLRLIDLSTGDEIIREAHGASSTDFVYGLKQVCGTYYGTAGPAFIEKLALGFRTEYALQGYVGAELDRWTNDLTPPNASPEQRRGLRRLALAGVAGALARELGVLPFDEGEIKEAISVLADLWHLDSAQVPDNVRGLQAIQGFMQRHAARFRGAMDNGTSTIRDLAGYTTADCYLFTPEGLQEACGGFDSGEVAKELDRRGLLFKNDPGRLQSKHTICFAGTHKRLRLFAVRHTVLEKDFLRETQPSTDPGTNGTSGADAAT